MSGVFAIDGELWIGFLAATIGVVVSEVIGRGRVLYGRLFLLVGVTVAAWATLRLLGRPRSPEMWVGSLLIDAVSIGAALLAWFGFRVHLSNSITLNLLTMLEDSPTPDQLEGRYGIASQTRKRVAVLQDSGYLDRTPEQMLVINPKSRLVLAILKIARGNRVRPL